MIAKRLEGRIPPIPLARPETMKDALDALRRSSLNWRRIEKIAQKHDHGYSAEAEIRHNNERIALIQALLEEA
jgi:hypothetical protein